MSTRLETCFLKIRVVSCILLEPWSRHSRYEKGHLKYQASLVPLADGEIGLLLLNYHSSINKMWSSAPHVA